jgi:hypothetical protein
MVDAPLIFGASSCHYYIATWNGVEELFAKAVTEVEVRYFFRLKVGNNQLDYARD